jgi:hypothetical protein
VSTGSVFHDLLGPEPTWLVCPCGERTSRVPCWDCSRRLEREAERDGRWAAAEKTFPARYAWAKAGAPELAQRVKVGDLDGVIARVLASSRAIFVGPSGAGKTSLAVACLRERLPDCMFVSALRLGTARIQSAAGQGEADLVERAVGARLLLIDELGGEAKTATNAVRDVVFARYDADLPTWVTTGFASGQLVETYGDGMLRRLTEGACLVKLGGQS